MDPDFFFEGASSDEEAELEASRALEGKSVQSPWDFAAYSESAAEEQSRRDTTTTVDEKISEVLEERPLSLPDSKSDDEEEDTGVDEAGGAEDVLDERGLKKSGNSRNSGASRPFFSSSEGSSFHANSFFELNLSRPLLRACEALGYHKPTPIQAACIPLALTGRDICGSAITGSGKTAAFALPVLERLLFRPKRVPAIRVLILTPARELAIQVHSMMGKLAQYTDIRSCLIIGGLQSKTQESALRSMPDIVVATPGRIIDHLLNSPTVGLEDLSVLILDEADRLLELGFSGEIQELLRLCPKRRQTMLFSATMTEEVDTLVKLSLTKPVRLQADPSAKRPATLTEEVIRIRREVNPEAVLLALCVNTFKEKVIIFSGTKVSAHRLKIIFGLSGKKAAELHGNLTQSQRLEALESFKAQKVDFLIATDVAARGLDIIGVQTVISFSCPRTVTSYIHRAGRTARAGREGHAVTFVFDSDRSLLKAIAKQAGSLLKSRIVSRKSVIEWSHTIELMEDQISAVLEKERMERELERADMEMKKAENMVAHKDEIFSRPKKTWFATGREKNLLAKAAKDALTKPQSVHGEVISVKKAEELDKKEKRRKEHEKNLPRKKRRRLEAMREMVEDEEEEENKTADQKTLCARKGKTTVVEAAYQQAKFIKSIKKARESGKVAKGMDRKAKNSYKKTQTRKEEMLELFQTDMNENKQSRASKKNNPLPRRKPKGSFKSKSRYKRRK